MLNCLIKHKYFLVLFLNDFIINLAFRLYNQRSLLVLMGNRFKIVKRFVFKLDKRQLDECLFTRLRDLLTLYQFKPWFSKKNWRNFILDIPWKLWWKLHLFCSTCYWWCDMFYESPEVIFRILLLFFSCLPKSISTWYYSVWV